MSEPEISTSWTRRRHGADASVDVEISELDRIVEMGKFGSDRISRDYGRDLVTQFVTEVLDGSMGAGYEVKEMIRNRLWAIDQIISAQTDAILHNPDYQAMESSWRGLWYLVERTNQYGERVKIRVLNTSKHDLYNDFRCAKDQPESALFNAVVGHGSGVLGSEPFSILSGDYAFSDAPEDMALLRHLGETASAAQAPFLAAACPQMFRCDSFSEVVEARDLKERTRKEYTFSWEGLRASKWARFVVLSLPRVLIRKPFSITDTNEFFREDADGSDTAKLLWANPSWVVTAQLARSFGEGSWSIDPSDLQGGGVIKKLHSVEFRSDLGDTERSGPTDAVVNDFVYSELCDLGFTPICSDTSGSRALLFEIPTINKVPVSEDEEGKMPVPSPTMLREVLIQSRLAQYIKCIVREKRAWFRTPLQCESYLNRWAARYTLLKGDEPHPAESGRPFAYSRFRIVADPAHSQPWFRVEGQVVPNLVGYGNAAPIEVSVPILLSHAAFEEGPPEQIAREDEPEVLIRDIQTSATAPVAAPPQSFLGMSDSLERIAELRRRNVLDESGLSRT